VEDHPDPVAELRRLAGVHSAYAHVEVADELAAAGDLEGAMAEYAAAHAKQPGNAELAFWHGVTLAANGREAEARELLERAYAERDGWRELLRRLPASGLFPDDQELIARLAGPRVDEA
jgi:tetratricopeptide (TPR) repeat protein